MSETPNVMNGVRIEFASDVVRDATPTLINGLLHSIHPNVAVGHRLSEVWISSIRDKHSCPSRHVTGNAADISRINGKRIGVHYDSDSEVRAIVDALQNRFETFTPSRRENYGPTIKLKEGKTFDPGAHNDHIHFSVNGPHECPSPSLLNRLIKLFRFGSSDDEICSL